MEEVVVREGHGGQVVFPYSGHFGGLRDGEGLAEVRQVILLQAQFEEAAGPGFGDVEVFRVTDWEAEGVRCGGGGVPIRADGFGEAGCALGARLRDVAV